MAPGSAHAGRGRVVAVVDEIFARALATPLKGALTYYGRTYSYRDLAARIALARADLERQAVARDRVAVVYIRDMAWTWIIGLALRSLGVTTAPGRTPEDLDQLDLGLVTVVVAPGETWPGLAEAAARRGCPFVVADGFNDDDAAAVPAEALRRTADAATGGYILLTSATTGVYKKILVDPAYEPEEVRDRIDQFPELGADSVVNMLNFGAWTAIGYFMPMIVWRLGARLVLDNSAEVWRSLAARDQTMAFVQPALLASVIAAPAEVPLRNDAMTLVVIAGVLSEDQWLAARERLTMDVRTTLGSTEAGANAVTRIETRDDLTWHHLRPGQMEVVDDELRRAPVGQIGEVRVRLNRVARYLGDDEATRRFFRDGYFYPGDLGVIRADGRLSLQGRVTDVINVMGDKYGTLPIETGLQARLGAQAVHVFSHAGPDGEVVHVVIQPGEPISAEALKAALLETLPRMRAVRVHRVDSFPRNNMGKIERVALKAQLGIV
jgi:acyl-coenzyme A synthetase/AMP-(fatty) acid ligase